MVPDSSASSSAVPDSSHRPLPPPNTVTGAPFSAAYLKKKFQRAFPEARVDVADEPVRGEENLVISVVSPRFCGKPGGMRLWMLTSVVKEELSSIPWLVMTGLTAEEELRLHSDLWYTFAWRYGQEVAL